MTQPASASTASLPGRSPDRASDVLRAGRHPLDPIFRPRSVAVIGASEQQGSVGRTLLWNLISSPFGGLVLPVNPNRASVLGIKTFPRLADIPDAQCKQESRETRLLALLEGLDQIAGRLFPHPVESG